MNILLGILEADTTPDGVVFWAILIPVTLGLGGLIVWVVYRKKNNPHHRKRRHHHRQLNPTLAQTGGLPPRRSPGQPPPGP